MSVTRIQQLTKERAGKITAATAITAAAAKETRSLTEEELRKSNGLFDESDALADQIKTLQRAVDADSERAAAEADAAAAAALKDKGTGSGSGSPESRSAQGGSGDDDVQKREDAFHAFLLSGERMDPEARKLLRPGSIRENDLGGLSPEVRALVAGTASAGGVTVPTKTESNVLEALKAFGGMRQAAQVMRTASGENIVMPTLDDTANEGALIGEGVAAVDTDMTFQSKTLGAHKYTTNIIKVSRELLQDSGANIPQIVGENFGIRVGRITNRHYTNADGSNKPEGITNVISVGHQGAGATSVSVAELLTTQHSVDPAFRVRRAGRFVGWMFNDDTLRAIRGLTGTEGQPLFQASFRAGDPDLILGFPYVINQDVPSMASSAKSIMFGDFGYHMIRDVRDLTIIRLDERYAEQDVVAFVGFMRTDSKYLQANDAARPEGDAVRFFQNAA